MKKLLILFIMLTTVVKAGGMERIEYSEMGEEVFYHSLMKVKKKAKVSIEDALKYKFQCKNIRVSIKALNKDSTRFGEVANSDISVSANCDPTKVSDMEITIVFKPLWDHDYLLISVFDIENNEETLKYFLN